LNLAQSGRNLALALLSTSPELGLRSQLAAMPSSACIASRQAAPAMAAAASGATERPVQSAHAGARMHQPFQRFAIAKHTGSSTKRLVPTTYTVHSPITIAHAWREPVMHF
jgi:hypothetical protein